MRTEHFDHHIASTNRVILQRVEPKKLCRFLQFCNYGRLAFGGTDDSGSRYSGRS